jgi:uncharacterized protein YgiM (DUF1202 family)
MSKLKWRNFCPMFAFLIGLLSLVFGGYGGRGTARYSGAAAFAQQTEAYITTSDVNVRSGPGTRYQIVARIKEGTKVNVAGREGAWLRVVSKHGNPPGYIDQRFARLADGQSRQAPSFAPGVYTTLADTYIRKGPGLHYEVITKIPKGIKVHVVAAEGDWLRVESKHGNLPGYVERTYVQRGSGN